MLSFNVSMPRVMFFFECKWTSILAKKLYVFLIRRFSFTRCARFQIKKRIGCTSCLLLLLTDLLRVFVFSCDLVMASEECWLCGEPGLKPEASVSFTETLRFSRQPLLFLVDQYKLKEPVNASDGGKVCCLCWELLSSLDKLTYESGLCLRRLRKRIEDRGTYSTLWFKTKRYDDDWFFPSTRLCFTSLRPISPFSCAVHCWVQLKAKKYMCCFTFCGRPVVSDFETSFGAVLQPAVQVQ